MKIGLTYDLKDDYRALGMSEDQIAEFDSHETIESIEGALRRLGFATCRIGNIFSLVSALAAGTTWDMVFNICEGLYGVGREAQVPALLDAYRIPCTFSDPCVLSLTLHKALAKRAVRDMGIPTPEFFLVESLADIARVRMDFPLFVKPYSEGTSKGVTAQSIIRSQGELEQMCAELLAQCQQPVLVERFLPGREFTVGIVGTGAQAEAVGIIEVVLRDQAEQGVYSYLNKDRCEELVSYERPDDDVSALAVSTALEVWSGLGCFDAGRVDLRCNEHRVPEFIEVNPLAGLHPKHSDLPIICTNEGIAYDELIRRIMASALRRCGLLDRAPDAVCCASVSACSSNSAAR
jgi:D-alanine-D-alanine ligase